MALKRNTKEKYSKIIVRSERERENGSGREVDMEGDNGEGGGGAAVRLWGGAECVLFLGSEAVM